MVAQSTIDNDDVERVLLRKSIAGTVAPFGGTYFREHAASGEPTHELWAAVVKGGFTSVNLPEEFGGGGAGLSELAVVCEEIATGGAPLLLMVVHSAICGPVIAEYGTAEQRAEWLPRWTEPDFRMCFAITEPDAGSNSHNLSLRAVQQPDGDWVLNGSKIYISGVDESQAMLVVAKIGTDERTGKGQLALFIVDTDAAGLGKSHIPTEIVLPEKQFLLSFDDVRVPASRLVGNPGDGLKQIFHGLNPERITGAALCNGISRHVLDKAVRYANERVVWKVPIGSHQGVAHPLAESKIQLELARLMTYRAAELYDGRGDAGEAANMAKFAAADAAMKCVDQAIQTHGGNGLATEYGIAHLWGLARLIKVAPVSREMILNHIAQHSLGLPKSY
ncbi:acyl-CoA dehydrogenase family protein [Sporichthya sp.]|uniref:acyl-CoA dehydrogenase family protein n=1 Tax=Sporichthya sp. TaxID=65475 RepID=UPI0017A76A1F|nr:acyl-CoA dehydrogenase family protein [Sporichthya sp.]MBA3744298.1 acyl-CoA/acyl-ACP dehydrogenase [Sporichthya sp.]